jgi:hypothetical protein
MKIEEKSAGSEPKSPGGQPAKLTRFPECYQISCRVAASADTGFFEGPGGTRQRGPGMAKQRSGPRHAGVKTDQVCSFSKGLMNSAFRSRKGTQDLLANESSQNVFDEFP